MLERDKAIFFSYTYPFNSSNYFCSGVLVFAFFYCETENMSSSFYVIPESRLHLTNSGLIKPANTSPSVRAVIFTHDRTRERERERSDQKMYNQTQDVIFRPTEGFFKRLVAGRKLLVWYTLFSICVSIMSNVVLLRDCPDGLVCLSFWKSQPSSFSHHCDVAFIT